MNIYFWLVPLAAAAIAAVYLVVRQLLKKPLTSLELASQIEALEAVIRTKERSSLSITPEVELERLRNRLGHLRHRYEAVREREINKVLADVQQDIVDAKVSPSGSELAEKLPHFQATERELMAELQKLRQSGRTA